MKLLLDMGLAPRTADHLQSLGHDAIHLRSRGLSRLSDQEIILLADAESRAVITFDLDFSRILALQRLAQPSVILLRLEVFTTDEVNAILTDLLSNYAADIAAGAVIVVDSHRIRVRPLPIL